MHIDGGENDFNSRAMFGDNSADGGSMLYHVFHGRFIRLPKRVDAFGFVFTSRLGWLRWGVTGAHAHARQ